jgi:hypothetical protein
MFGSIGGECAVAKHVNNNVHDCQSPVDQHGDRSQKGTDHRNDDQIPTPGKDASKHESIPPYTP